MGLNCGLIFDLRFCPKSNEYLRLFIDDFTMFITATFAITTTVYCVAAIVTIVEKEIKQLKKKTNKIVNPTL